MNRRMVSLIGIFTTVLILTFFNTSSVFAAEAKQTTKVEKTIAICIKKNVNIRKKASSKSKIVGSLKYKEQVKVVSSSGNWIKVKTTKVTGYVYKPLLKIKKITSDKTEASEEKAPSADDTKKSVTGEDVVKYALKFVGNRYRYGGTSLTKGTDCSGFTMSVYKKFSYNIGRSSRDQAASAGKKVSVSCRKPGDLIFYVRRGRVSHVALYIGDNKIVHASTAATGIKISKYNYNKPYMARRVIN